MTKSTAIAGTTIEDHPRQLLIKTELYQGARAIGVGAVAGAFGLPRLTRDLGPDRMVALGTAGTVIALLLFALARHWTIALVGSLIAGMSWIMVLATTNVSAQIALPGWVRGRGLSIFGTIRSGSAIWGKIAALAGLPTAHILAGQL